MYLLNKYTEWYNSIIQHARDRVKFDGYGERHHVIPKSLGGSNDPTNLVLLTAREHFICHLLLVKMTTGDHKRRMANAAWGMATRRNKFQDKHPRITSRTYEFLKSNLKQSPESNLARSKKLKGRKLGPMSDEHKKKLSRPKTVEHRKKLSEARLGKSWGYTHSDETKKKMSTWQKGVPKEKVMCENCGKEISQMNYARWHGPKCKNIQHS